MNPQFPVYIVSKGRWESRITPRYMDRMGTPYRVIVEEQEYADYAAVIDPAKLLVLDPAFKRDYDTFNALGAEKGTGSGPARNFAWEHARSIGAEWHWTVDDNIQGFYRLNRNDKIMCDDGTPLRCMEDFVLRYSNVAMAGPQYEMFAPRKSVLPPLRAEHPDLFV